LVSYFTASQNLKADQNKNQIQATTVYHPSIFIATKMKPTTNNRPSSSSNMERNLNLLRLMSAQVPRAITQATATEDNNMETIASGIFHRRGSAVSFLPAASGGIMSASGAVSSLSGQGNGNGVFRRFSSSSNMNASERRKRLISVIDSALELTENEEDDDIDFLAIQ
jgi:hypothetical protein